MFFRIAVREADWVDVCYSLRAVLDRKRSGVLHGSRLSHVVRRRGGMGRAVGRFIEFAARALVIRRTTWRALAIGALVDAAIVLPIAPPGSSWWRFADKARGGDFNEEIGWPELVQTIASIRDSLPVQERSRLGILAAGSGQAGAINLYGPELGLPKAICGMNSHWLRGYGDPPPETVIVVGMTRDFAQSANADLARRYCSETVTTYHSLFPVNHVQKS